MITVFKIKKNFLLGIMKNQTLKSMKSIDHQQQKNLILRGVGETCHLSTVQTITPITSKEVMSELFLPKQL